MTPDFNKNNNQLLPAIIQDAETKTVLMLGYMNQEAFEKTLKTQKITFFSRSKNRLWTKGEESGHFLELTHYALDCDQDTLLFQVNPVGPTCHKGTDTCWGDTRQTAYGFLSALEQTIENRKKTFEKNKIVAEDNSYVVSLFQKGINKIAQKVGEEAVEMVIEAKDSNDLLFLNESADLLFHYLILLQAKGFQLHDVVEILKTRR